MSVARKTGDKTAGAQGAGGDLPDPGPAGASAALRVVLAGLIAQRTGRGQATGSHAALATSGHSLSGREKEAGPSASLGEIIAALDERAFGLMILLLALPCCLPFIYLIPQIVALPILALAAQLAMGCPAPWLPPRLNNRAVPLPGMLEAVSRAERYIGWFEHISKPRLTFLSSHLGARLVGALMLIPAASILVPLPSTNTIPGIGVAVSAIGLVERDGFLIILGLVTGLAWVALLVFFGEAALSMAKDAFLSGL